MLIPQLRVPTGGDLKKDLTEWLDRVNASSAAAAAAPNDQDGAENNNNNSNSNNNNNNSSERNIPDFTSSECVRDLVRLDTLRRTIGEAITAPDAYESALESMETMQEYHAALLVCEQHKLALPKDSIRMEWMVVLSSSADGQEDTIVEIASCIPMERASILWNTAAVEAYQASQQDLTKKSGWQKANKHLQASSSLMHHLHQLLQNQQQPPNQQTDNQSSTQNQSKPSNHQQLNTTQQPSSNLSQNQQQHHQLQQLAIDFQLVPFWEKALQAQAQMAGYEMANANARPRHLLLAKLATGASPLWDESANMCEQVANNNNNNNSHHHNGIREFNPEMIGFWVTSARSWSFFMQAKAEYHESVTHKDKSKHGMELARLQRSLVVLQQCEQLIQTHEVEERISREVPLFMETIQSSYNQAQEHGDAMPPASEVRDIRGELLSKGPQPIPKTMSELKQPLFTNLLGPEARRAVEAFHRDMGRLVYQMSGLVEEKTESARKTLASVNLPHSVTAYKQEQSGGGIPMELWDRVESIQRQARIHTLKNDLWGLRDVAEHARSIFRSIEKQLEEDLQMDSLFRQQHPTFEGHDVQEIQRMFRTSLENYEKLLVKSQEGDSVLLRRLEMLDTDPKYKLLQFQKSQLDRLLPGAGNSHPVIDTTLLSRLLVELSALIHEREVALNMLREEGKNYDIHAKVAEIDPQSPTADQEYHQAVIQAQKAFSVIAYDVQLNTDKQGELLDTILDENERFMDAREASASSAASDSCIAMIEDAIEEIDQLTKHLKEGRKFYNLVTPKLEQLKQQVGDASVRLTVERCEYEDNAHHSEERRQQEQRDAQMAASLAGNNQNSNNNSNNNNDNNNDTIPARSQPGAVNVSHTEPQVRVDDEKVASLVAMDFDPDKVVAALRKYDNNVEQALNELLSC